MAIRIAFALYALAAAVIIAAWTWLGRPVLMPPSPLGPDGKVYCISYAPFRGSQTPLDLSTHIGAAQIEADLRQLKLRTDCVRTYSNDFGLDQVPAIAQRLSIKVIQGLWLSSHADRSQQQVATAIALAKKYPDTIRAIVVGNEVLLRGEMSARSLADTIRAVKAQVPVPVTYADVWEFWLRNRELTNLVDFVTVHILPYWEDIPIPAENAAAHVEAIRRRVVAAFPSKDVLIGETGWPSHGRMRGGALPSPANQALVLHEVLALARRANYRVNIIEAFDQPWKRQLEGTVGGYWGLYDDRTREPKFAWGEAVSNHPYWPWQAAGGSTLALLVFAGALATARRRDAAESLSPGRWAGVTAVAAAGGLSVAWAVESMLIEGFGLGGWLRTAAYAAAAMTATIVAGPALASVAELPSFAALLGPAEKRPRGRVALILGAAFLIGVVLAIQTALGLAFDPRYRDFPNAALTAIVVPLLAVTLLGSRSPAARGAAETAAAAVLALCAVYIAFNETLANWQAVWFCALLLTIALTLLRVRGAPD